jgi:hypothetical protein
LATRFLTAEDPIPKFRHHRRHHEPGEPNIIEAASGVKARALGF